MNSFDKLSPQAMEALASKDTDAQKLLGKVVAEEVVASEITEYKDLPYRYREFSEAHYEEMSGFVGRSIGNAQLPSEYRMPRFEDYEDSFMDLYPYYEAFKSKGWAPMLVFVPQNLSIDQWSKLLHGFQPGHISGISLGVDHDEFVGSMLESKPNKMDVAVMSISATPMFCDITPNGVGNREALQELATLPGGDGQLRSSDALKYSPDLSTYLAMQYWFLNHNVCPVDDLLGNPGTTFIKSNVLGNRIIAANWRSDKNKVELYPLSINDSHSAKGIRPAILDSDIDNEGAMNMSTIITSDQHVNYKTPGTRRARSSGLETN